jgi:hypothetical protein
MKKVYLAIVCLFFISCSTIRQGKVSQGKDGKIENATIIAKCTPPPTPFAKELEAKIKATMDSLRYAPSGSFDASFTQKVVQLHKYSTEGFDVNNFMFQICQMANNRGMTSEQTAKLITKGMEIWENAKKNQ